MNMLQKTGRWLLVFTAAASLVYAAKAGIPVDAALRDFKIMNAIFARSHATAFKQIPVRDAPDIFAGTDLVSLGGFIGRILSYYGRIHVDHTMIGFPPEVIESFGLKSKFFPFPLKFFDGRAYFDAKEKDISFGAELTHINGKSIKEIIEGFAEFPRARTGEAAWDSHYLSEQFSSWYFLTGKDTSPWRLRILRGNPPKQVEIDFDPGVNPAPVKRVSLEREYFKPVLHSMFMDKHKLAYFAINSFMPSGTPYQSFEKWMEYFGQFNNESRRRGATTLILDLRQNRGGVMPLAAASSAWFIEAPITDKSESSVHTRLLPYREFALAINGQRAAPADFDKLEKYLQTEFSDVMQDGYFATRKSNARYVDIQPLADIHRFQKIYVVIGPATYSAAVYFARILKLANPNVVLVGSETGSAGDGHAAETLITYRLPESGIFFDVPLARVRFAPLVKGQVPGKGLMPDVALAETAADFLAGRDGVLEALVASLAVP
jgi:C-terminal processing protease CtpA/Prc